MNRVTLAMLPLMGLISCAMVACATPPAAARCSIAFAAAPNTSTSLVAEAAQWTKEVYSARTVSREIGAQGATLSEAAKMADLLRGPSEPQIVVFVSLPSCSNSIAWASDKAAAVNIAALQFGIAEDEQGRKQLLNRVQRESIRAVGGMMGIPTCPMRTCALSAHKNLKELDEKGRGLCPPCMMRAASRVKALGLAAPAKPPETAPAPRQPSAEVTPSKGE